MREIKFRAWDTVCGCWVEPPWKLYLNGGVSIAGSWATSDVMLTQYTGLNDKNGKEIYEGDVFRYGKANGKDVLYVVKWNDDSACFAWEQVIPVLTFGFDMSEVEVVGNIYENPELITGKDSD